MITDFSTEGICAQRIVERLNCSMQTVKKVRSRHGQIGRCQRLSETGKHETPQPEMIGISVVWWRYSVPAIREQLRQRFVGGCGTILSIRSIKQRIQYIHHDDVIEWKHFPRNWPLCGEFTVPVNSPHKVQWRGALLFYLTCAWINGWVNNREAGDLIHHGAHFDVTVMRFTSNLPDLNIQKTKYENAGWCHLNVRPCVRRIHSQPVHMCWAHFCEPSAIDAHSQI